VSDHFEQKASVCSAHISQLKHEIATLAPQTSIQKTKMLSDHTRAVSRLQAEHRTALDRLRSECDRKLTPVQSQRAHALAPDSLVDSINSTRSQISDELEHKAERQEIQTQERLLGLTNQIAGDRRRAKQLEKQVEEMRAELESVRALAALRRTERELVAPGVDSAASEEHLELARANFLSKENELRKELQNQIDGWRRQLNGARASSVRFQKRIRETETDDSEALKLASQEKDECRKVHEALITEKARLRQRKIEEGIEKEGLNHQKMEGLGEAARRQLRAAKLEHETLLKEIRRLDFMLYGRNGQYQQPKVRVGKRPFV
jgi:chromosome segregation ATPase